MRYWSTPPHTDVQQTREWLDGMIGAASDVSDDFIVEFQREVIGKAGCWKLPEIGYILHPDHWGRGLASEALSAVIGHVFATRAVEAIKADVDPRNEGSLRLLARLGFVETHRAERTWHVGDEWCDSVYLVLKRPGFLGQAPNSSSSGRAPGLGRRPTRGQAPTRSGGPKRALR
jgi:RimJ/RimL family protein N-acetyltransferase